MEITWYKLKSHNIFRDRIIYLLLTSVQLDRTIIAYISTKYTDDPFLNIIFRVILTRIIYTTYYTLEISSYIISILT